MRFIFSTVLLCALGLGGCARAPQNGRSAAPSHELPAASTSASVAAEPPPAEPAPVLPEPEAPPPAPAPPPEAAKPALPAVAPKPARRRAPVPEPKASEAAASAARQEALPPTQAAVPLQEAAAPQESTPPQPPDAAKRPEPATAPEPPKPPQEAAAPAEAQARTQTLDLTSLEQRLRDTHAIGLFTKLSLKNQVDDLLGQFRAFYNGQSKMALADLHQRYDLLLMKVLSLLQNSDPPLAADISASRSAIWGILADPKKFAKLQI